LFSSLPKILGRCAEMRTRVLGLGLESRSCWTRTPVLHIWTQTRDMRTRTVGTRPDSANCTDRASLTELSRGLLCNIIMLFMVLWKMPRARARQFFSSGLGFGLETQKPGLEIFFSVSIVYRTISMCYQLCIIINSLS